ncbi:MAG: DedA family protein [Sulfuricurvum sp.]|jgi:membrane protein DedA with SNARE-associated domain|uniref:DedA family protein n=1 Tax=Sulfuricurvum sp. TaxID=2025608 RepID=UPI0025EDA23E|nr:DedA family protein [Sulfuricurvum sp.]MCK9373997.1 DedA family protein [Sulfuricurvum sp.]
MFLELTQYLVDIVQGLGYMGIVLLMAVESSFIPFPSEVVMIPAGYLASKGEMNLLLVIVSGLTGSMIGAYVNYFGALWIGRRFLDKYGRYFFISPETLDKVDGFFLRHGAISTFTGRLIPGVRQLISIPAGLGRMNLSLFSLYTALGAGIWGAVLALIGYFIGDNEALIGKYLKEITMITAGVVAVIIALYVWRSKSSIHKL